MGDLNAVQQLTSERLESEPRSPDLLKKSARVAHEMTDEHWILERVRLSRDSNGASEAHGTLASSAADALWAATVFLETTSSTEARLEKLNALRATGQIDRAKELAQEVDTSSLSPAAHYALGALALADPGASPGEARSHLMSALSDDTAPGRVRAALILAHVRAGALDDAKKELELLQMLTRHHPATEALGALVEAKGTESTAPAQAEPHPPKLQPLSYLIDEAQKAASKGATARARRLFHLVLARDADNCEAQNGLQSMDGEGPLCRAEAQ
jgi:hypothetical protein